uniref:hypothetical protein n=1 Tax=Brachybacterium sp. GPGPB12 TaxID=3023517 RepID=UPI00404AB68A
MYASASGSADRGQLLHPRALVGDDQLVGAGGIGELGDLVPDHVRRADGAVGRHLVQVLGLGRGEQLVGLLVGVLGARARAAAPPGRASSRAAGARRRPDRRRRSR